MQYAVDIADLYKRYQGREVLRGINLRMKQGRTLFIVGPNGCGKTTLIETIVGIRRIQEGQVQILGALPGDPALRSKIRVCLQGAVLHPQVTVLEHLQFIAAIYKENKSRVNEIAEQFDIANLFNRRFGRLSGGQQKRVMVASTLLGESDLIVLDEPTSGVDLESRLSLWRSLRDAIAGKDTTLIVTTHDLNEAEEYADEVFIIREGMVCSSGGVDKLITESGLVGVLSVPADIVGDLMLAGKKAGRYVLSNDRGTTTLGYSDRHLISEDKLSLNGAGVTVIERSPRLMDAYLLTYQGEYT